MTLTTKIAAMDLNPAKLAKKAGVSRSTITRIMGGETTPHRATIKKIVDATGGAITRLDLLSCGDDAGGAVDAPDN